MKIGFIGTGNMGTAIMKGYLSVHENSNHDLYAYDKENSKLDALSRDLGIQSCESIADLVTKSEIIVLAVKPNIFEMILPEINEVYQPHQILVSIAAGISIRYLESFIKHQNPKVVRVMPNTPAMVNEGMTAISKNDHLDDEEFQGVAELFRSIGKAEVLDESLMDTVIGVSGSSPAYTYMFIEALIDGAVAGGMKREQAVVFAGQAVLGAARMVLETGIDPVTLRENVCSPGGTTIEAVQVLKERGFQDIVKKAAEAASEKSKMMTK
ncbi:pyrroline-5-carboxylate reductase [Sinanaerobacter chloroacetimidivorans]|jgi:pyrroline-5-carboxylate reductase|uniref:Pyrroline-5-carboxylate reductase n=1 Tax=Sinanaerobacter chloroacetimidivorans TaxID=2818044 RepID=A0A8J7VXI1_9FIRM|nr:pyrroline-5-carboxylate reductase [Sinanaerobacter chloroacetimidivorans]MBR0596864.1 pyrroline-5-carboxylate reductase [Sinanaerobacter chloroacetimidivorans]